MSILILQSTYAIGPTISTFFLGTGGVEPYLYEVLPGGAGGTINASTGVYTAPAVVPLDPSKFYDTIRVTDYNGSTSITRILIGDPLQLVMEVLRRVMALPEDHVYLYNQKIFQPTDSDLYIAVRVENSSAFGNINQAVPTLAGMDNYQAVSMIDTIGFDLISRSTAALKRRPEFLRVWASDYAQSQQNLNGYLMGRDPLRPMIMIPDLDGAAIPYRFRASYLIQYADKFVQPSAYYDTFTAPEITTNP
jgi:hypothetical protein